MQQRFGSQWCLRVCEIEKVTEGGAKLVHVFRRRVCMEHGPALHKENMPCLARCFQHGRAEWFHLKDLALRASRCIAHCLTRLRRYGRHSVILEISNRN